MIHTLELDKQTASFVRQLEEQRRIEKNLMVERVRGTKEGLESVFHDIRERVEALERMTIDLPIVVRLDGTNAAEGRAMLADAAPPNLYVEETMLSAAERVVALAKERG